MLQTKTNIGGRLMFKGKAIYNPSGKAGEYSYWACNFYVGCNHRCSYCFLKKGRGKEILGGNEPKLKKCFKDANHALEVFKKEVNKNKAELMKHGIFFSFSTDPMIPGKTAELTIGAVKYCNDLGIPVKILTKDHRALIGLIIAENMLGRNFKRNLIALGFTLTGHDELEPGASPNYLRATCLDLAKQFGYKTFASIEPIIDFSASKIMIKETIEYCDLYKVGLLSGAKYDVVEAQTFVEWLGELDNKVYIKENIQKLTGYTNFDFDNFVERDYNIFTN